MRRTLTTLLAAALSTVLLAPTAGANELLSGSRLGGALTQLVPTGSTTGPELPEITHPVDLSRYAGTWHQVAALPQPYTLQCVANTTATYAVVGPTTISVDNTCDTFLGARSTIAGTAEVRSPASLRVNFPGVPFQNPAGPANYRVTYLAEDYSLAIVGDPQRLSGFVLSRSPQLSPERWHEVRQIVEARGWNSCLMLTHPTAGGRGEITPLCLL